MLDDYSGHLKYSISSCLRVDVKISCHPLSLDLCLFRIQSTIMIYHNGWAYIKNHSIVVQGLELQGLMQVPSTFTFHLSNRSKSPFYSKLVPQSSLGITSDYVFPCDKVLPNLLNPVPNSYFRWRKISTTLK